jgi:DNA-directed RNA polymerase specialized sigma24 family protein
LFPPNRSSFARESDAPKVEEWLREASLLNGGCNSDLDERFFKALNIHLGQSYTRNEWNLFFGDTLERVDPFLQDTGKDASYWCAPGSAKRFDILREGETVTALSPDYENSPEQEQRNIDPAELRLFKLCPCSLSVRLSQSLGVENTFGSLEDGIYRMGTLRGPDRRRHRAFLLAHAERTAVSLAKQAVGQEGEGIIIVTPAYCPETVDFAFKNKLLYVPLRDMLLPDFSLVETFDESLKQFFAVHAEKELLTPDQIAGFMAIAQKLDGNPRLKAPTHATVLNLYCIEGLSTDEIARKNGFSKGTVINRKEALEQKLGRTLNELRTYSGHFEKIAETLSDDRASGYDARKAIYDDAAYEN